MPAPRRIRFVMAGLGALAILVAIAPAALAQAPAGPRGDAGQRQPAPRDRRNPDKWRLTFRAGESIPGAPSSGLSALPPVGLPQNFLPGLADRPVPSWYFGDGSTILNANLPPGGHPITPLDGVLTSAAIARSAGPLFGFTISRAITPRFRLEFSADASRTAPAFTSSARQAIETSRAGFVDAFGSLFAVPFFQNPSVSSTATVADGSRVEWLLSGAIDVMLHATPRSEWHATVGVGLLSVGADGPTATLDGRDAFHVVSRAFAEEDRVTISSLLDRRTFLLLGGGWSHTLTRRWGVSGDLRVALSGPGEVTQVSTSPTVTHFSPPDIPTIVTGPGAPTLTFSNNGVSTLSTTLAPFTTFVSTGVQVRAELTAGLFLRF